MSEVFSRSLRLVSFLGLAALCPAVAQTPRDTALGIPVSKYVPALGTVAVRLELSPAHARVEIDGLVLPPTAGGDEVHALATPGRHALKVTKDGHAALKQDFDVAAGGFEGRVWLAPINRQATVHLTSGRKLVGVLVSQNADGLTLQKGTAKFTLAKGQYDGVELGGLVPAGESFLRAASKATTGKAGDAKRATDAGQADDAKPSDDDEDKGRTKRASRSRYPDGFKKAFYISRSSRDQHGNPITTRKRKRSDRETGWQYEFWLKKPRMEFVLIPSGEFMMGNALRP